jgi:predicted PurR-regulated permease PerM
LLTFRVEYLAGASLPEPEKFITHDDCLMNPNDAATADLPATLQGAAATPEPEPEPAVGVTEVSEAPTSEPAAAAATLLPLPVVDIRNLSLFLMALFASLFVLQWAKAVFIPLMLGLVFSYALSPVVNALELRKVPRWAGAAVLLLAIFASLGTTAWSLSDEAARLIETLPAAAQKLKQAVQARKPGSGGTLETVQKAAAQIEQAANEPSIAGGRGVMRVIVEPARFNVRDYLWTGTIGLLALIGQTTVVVFLTFFLLVSGDTFRRKLIKHAGPTLSRKKITLQALDEITVQIQRYLQVQLLTSALVGVLTGLAFALLGLENAAVWGIAAAVLNLVPYVGSLATAVAGALVGFLQFGTLNMALAIGGASMLIHTVIGNLVTPWLTGRASRMSPVAVFIALLAWGWLWGVWGLLLGIPIMMIVKAVCERIDHLKPVAEFLGS